MALLWASFSLYCCEARRVSEQQHNQDLREICKVGQILEFITFYQNALHLTRVHCATFYQNALCHNSHTNTRKFGGWEHALFTAQTQESSLWKIFLPHLRHAGVFQMSTMVNLGIGFQIKSFWLVGALNLTRRWAFSLWPRNRGDTVYKFQLARRWCQSEKMSCHSITCMCWKWMWFWSLASK